MEKDFWLKKWEEQSIGFHQDKVHPILEKHLSVFKNKKLKDSVLVPLCGKSLDMIFLRDNGYEVIGSEFSKIACEDFFKENKIVYTLEETSEFIIFKGQNITLYCGDYFKLKLEEKASYLYDRAAIVALDPKDRERYAKKHAELIAQNGKALIFCFEYNQSLCSGPPFSVEEYFVREYYEKDFEIEVLEENNIEIGNPRMKEAGVKSAIQKAYLLNRKAAQ